MSTCPCHVALLIRSGNAGGGGFAGEAVEVGVVAEPFGEAAEAFGEARLGLVSQLRRRARQVRVGALDVAGLRGLALDYGPLADRALDFGDEGFECDRV